MKQKCVYGLYVEDDRSQLDLLKLLFLDTPLNLLVCDNVADSLKLLSYIQFTIVILDLNLGQGGSGITILEYIQQNKIDCKLLIISGYFDSYQEDLKKFKGLNIIMVEKPMHIETLKGLVLNLCN